MAQPAAAQQRWHGGYGYHGGGWNGGGWGHRGGWHSAPTWPLYLGGALLGLGALSALASPPYYAAPQPYYAPPPVYYQPPPYAYGGYYPAPVGSFWRY